MPQKEKPDVYAIIELLVTKGPKSLAKIKGDLNNRSGAIPYSVQQMLKKLPGVFIKDTSTPIAMYLIKDRAYARVDDIYKMYRDAAIKRKILPKLKKDAPKIKGQIEKPKESTIENVGSDLRRLLESAFQEGLKGMTIGDKKLDVSVIVSGSVEILFGFKK